MIKKIVIFLIIFFPTYSIAYEQKVDIVSGVVLGFPEDEEILSGDEKTIFKIIIENQDKIEKAMNAFLQSAVSDGLRFVRDDNGVTFESFDPSKTLFAMISLDKVVLFSEKVELNNQLFDKITAYIAMNFFVIVARTQNMIYSRPFIIPFHVPPGMSLSSLSRELKKEIISNIITLFSDKHYSPETKKIMIECILGGKLASDQNATYGITRVDLSKQAMRSFDNRENVKTLARLYGNASLAYKYLVIPSEEKRDLIIDSQDENLLVYQGLDFAPSDIANTSEGVFLGKMYHIPLCFPPIKNRIQIKIKTNSKVLKDSKYHKEIGYMAGIYFDYKNEKFKSVDAVTGLQSRKRVKTSDIQFYNALLNALSKLQGGIDACKKVKKKK